MNLLVAIPPCRDQIPYLWLTGWQYHDHNTLWRFYKLRRAQLRIFELEVPLQSWQTDGAYRGSPTIGGSVPSPFTG